MGIKYFTEEEIEYLSSNIYVESVNEKQITYTIEFKQFFVREYMNGKGPTLIFESVGLYKRMLGAKRIEKATSRWMKAYQQEAVLFQKIEKQRAYEEAGEQADLIQNELENLPIVQDYRQKMQDASDLIQYVSKSIEEKINEELRHG